jgi:hypothetical protein
VGVDTTNLKGKSALCWDNGIFFEFALALSKEYGQVYYYAPYVDAYPGMPKAVMGSEWVDGAQLDTFDGHPVRRIINPWDYIDDVDVVIFPDCYDEDVQSYLKRKGKPVFGALRGAKLELDRYQAKEVFRRHGMDVPPVERIVGMNKLRAYLQNPQNRNVWLKIARFRLHFETFHHESYERTAPMLAKLDWELGPLKDITEFVVERDVDAVVEEGIDTYSVNGQFPRQIVQGTESKDSAFACAFFAWDDISRGNRLIIDKLSGVLAETGYQGLLCTETRTTAEGRSYLIDPCTRGGFPSLNCWSAMCDNLGEITWEVAHGRMVEPRVGQRYGLEAIVRSKWLQHNHQALRFPDAVREHVKIKNVIKIDGNYFALNLHGSPEFASIVAAAGSFGECIEILERVVPQIDGVGLSIDADAVDQAIGEFNKMVPKKMVSIPPGPLSLSARL